MQKHKGMSAIRGATIHSSACIMLLIDSFMSPEDALRSHIVTSSERVFPETSIKKSLCAFPLYFMVTRLIWCSAVAVCMQVGGGGHSFGSLILVWPAGLTNLLGSNHHWLCIESRAHNGARTKPALHWKTFYHVMHPCSVMRVTWGSRLTAGWSGQEYCFLQSDKTPPRNLYCRHLYSEKKVFSLFVFETMFHT